MRQPKNSRLPHPSSRFTRYIAAGRIGRHPQHRQYGKTTYHETNNRQQQRQSHIQQHTFPSQTIHATTNLSRPPLAYYRAYRMNNCVEKRAYVYRPSDMACRTASGPGGGKYPATPWRRARCFGQSDGQPHRATCQTRQSPILWPHHDCRHEVHAETPPIRRSQPAQPARNQPPRYAARRETSTPVGR